MTSRTRGSSFSRNLAAAPASLPPGLKPGPNGTNFVSSGIPDLDKTLGGGFAVGSLIMVMEDAEAPHHMLLLRNFMAQGFVHSQPLFYASPSKEPRGFLGTLPSPSSSNVEKSRRHDPEQEKDLRIAWQYKKYFSDQQQNLNSRGDTKHEYSTEFDLRKPLERKFLSGQRIDCVSMQEGSDLSVLRDRCISFLASYTRGDGNISFGGRIAIQSLCAPQCQHFNLDWDTLSFVQSLKSMIRSSNAVALVTFPHSLLSPSLSKRLQHLSDTLLSVKAMPDEDKELETLLTGYQDMVGLLNIHKVARVNAQVPVILEASTFSVKLRKRRYLALECLNQAPVDGSSGSSYGTSGTCSGSSKSGALDF